MTVVCRVTKSPLYSKPTIDYARIVKKTKASSFGGFVNREKCVSRFVFSFKSKGDIGAEASLQTRQFA